MTLVTCGYDERTKKHRANLAKYASNDPLTRRRYLAALRVLERANQGYSLARFGTQTLIDAAKLATLATGWYGGDVAYFVVDELVHRANGKARTTPSPIQSFRYELRRMLADESWDVATFEMSARALATDRRIEYADVIIKAELNRYKE